MINKKNAMRTEKIINSISILPGIQQVVGVSEILYGIALACFHALTKPTFTRNLFLRRDIRIIARGFLRCIPLIGTIFSIVLLKRECQRPSKSEALKPLQKIVAEIEDKDTKEAYIEAVNSMLNFLNVDDNSPVNKLLLYKLLCSQIASQAKRLDFSSLDNLKTKIRKEFKENFKKFRSGDYPSKLLEAMESENDLLFLLLLDLQLDYGMRMKPARRDKYLSNPKANFDKDWNNPNTVEHLERELSFARFTQISMNEYLNSFNCVTDCVEFVISGNSQALTNTSYLSVIDKNELLKRNINQSETNKYNLDDSGYLIDLDQRNIKPNILLNTNNEFLNEKFLSKTKSELHYECIDYIMEVGEVKENGFRIFQKGYLVYTLADPNGKMVRFELPIDLTPFQFESEVGVNEIILLMIKLYDSNYDTSAFKKIETFNEELNLITGSKLKSDIQKIINNYEQILVWAEKTANELGSLYEKIYLSLGEATPLPSIQNLDDEMPFYFICKLCDESKNIQIAYHNYLTDLNLMKLAVVEKRPITHQSLLDINQLKSTLLNLIPEEHLGYISHYLDTEIQNVYGRKQPHLNELIKQCELFLKNEKLPKEVCLASMNKKIARDLLSFLRSAIAVREENLKAEEVDLEKYHNQRLLSLNKELEKLIASQFPAETDEETLRVCKEFLEKLYNHAILQEI